MSRAFPVKKNRFPPPTGTNLVLRAPPTPACPAPEVQGITPSGVQGYVPLDSSAAPLTSNPHPHPL